MRSTIIANSNNKRPSGITLIPITRSHNAQRIAYIL